MTPTTPKCMVTMSVVRCENKKTQKYSYKPFINRRYEWKHKTHLQTWLSEIEATSYSGEK